MAVLVLVAARAGGAGGGRTKLGVVEVTRRTPAPDFVLPDLVDARLQLDSDQFRGRPLVLNFFASWCGPCRKEMPTLQSAAARFSGTVDFVGVDHLDSRSQALDLLARTGVTYRTGYDRAGRVAEDYGVRGLPTTVFVSGDGRIVARRLGEIRGEELDDALLRLFEALPDDQMP